MAFGAAEVVFVLALAAAGLGYKYLKDAKSRKQVGAGGLIVAFLVVAFAGVFGYPALLSAAPGAQPKAGPLWDAILTDASDTDRTETEYITAPFKSVKYIMNDANMDGLGDLTFAADISNLNVGDNTELWAGDVKMGSVGTVIVSGVPTPVANYTADRTRFNVAYTDTDAPGDWVQIHDAFYTKNAVTGGIGTITIGLPIDPAVADDLPAGGSFIVTFVVVGVTLTMEVIES